MRNALAALLAALVVAGCLAGPSEPVDPAALEAAEHGIATGSLSAVAATAGHELGLRRPHDEVRFVLVMGDAAPQSRLTLNVTAPDGRSDEVGTAPVLYVLPGLRAATAFQDGPAGDWVARLSLSGAASGYEVHWCTSGAGGDAANLACRPDGG